MTTKQINYIRAKEIEKQNMKRIKKICPEATEGSGIYLFWRIGEDDILYGYVGKSKNVLQRLAQHLTGYEQHIDKSIKKYGLYDETKNIYGYHPAIITYCPPYLLDKLERQYIQEYANKGYQLRNVESGGTNGKYDINERKPARGYRDGVAQGERNIIKQIAHLFDLHLKAIYKEDKPSKNAIKALEKFEKILHG